MDSKRQNEGQRLEATEQKLDMIPYRSAKTNNERVSFSL